MQLNAYTIHDAKALQYHAPWFAVSHGVATRIVADLANDLNTLVGRHPRDYTVWQCGTWDDNTGQFVPLSPLVHVCDVVTLIKPDEQQPTLPLDQPRQATNGKAL